MTPDTLVKKIREEIISSNSDFYKDQFTNSKMIEVTDEYWKEALVFFQELDPKKHKVFFKILRQVAVDSVSNFFGILDGVCGLEGVNEEFLLFLKDKPKIELNGDLQDIFLELEEN